MALRLKKPIIYVTRDIERALGMEPVSGYFIISNDSAHGREIQAKYPESVWLIKNPANSAAKTDGDNLAGALDTYDLLTLPEVQNTIDKHDADVLVFQNTPRIERLAQEMHWNLLNPSAALARTVEEKISQVTWLGDDAKLLPPHRIALVKNVAWTNTPGERFVLQFNHTHTGQGTFIITSREELDQLKAKFPERECRVVDFIEGPVFTVNAVAKRIKTIVGSPSYQITGLPPFTDLPFSTIGNDWSLPTEQEIKEITDIAHRVGKRLKANGWKGLFGIDTIKDAKTGKMYLLEINARQAASAVYESTLQKAADPGSPTLFEAHIAALLRHLGPFHTAQIQSGAQIVSRVTHTPHAVDTTTLRAHDLAITAYENTLHNKELFRIQSKVGIMESHNTLNALGKTISSCIK